MKRMITATSANAAAEAANACDLEGAGEKEFFVWNMAVGCAY